MPEPDTVKIADIFSSAQGEGVRMGNPAVFVRLAGCSLACDFCDTPEALSGGVEMDVANVLAQVSRLALFAGFQVVITGGEPLEQDLVPLTVALARAGYFLSVETNGLHFQDLAVNWWTVSPKPAAAFRVHPRIRPLADEVKLVVTPEVSVQVVRRLRKHMPRPSIFLQPDARNDMGYTNARNLFEHCIREGIAGVRLGLQLHRVYGMP